MPDPARNELQTRLAQLRTLADGLKPQQRGRRFERWLKDLLDLDGLQANTSLRPGGEEIDGSFLLEGSVYLFEAKWTKERLPASSMYAFKGKVDGKLVGTVGFYISMAGFNKEAVEALERGKDLNVLLVDGDEVELAVSIGAKHILREKLRAAAELGLAYSPAQVATSLRPGGPGLLATLSFASRKVAIVVEGPADAIVAKEIAARLLEGISPDRGLLPQFGVEVWRAGSRSGVPKAAALILDSDESYVHAVLLADADYDDERVVSADLLNDDAVRGRKNVDVVIAQPTVPTAWLGTEIGTIDQVRSAASSMDRAELAKQRREIGSLDRFAQVIERVAREASETSDAPACSLKPSQS